jgi:hypothetical protein
MQYFVGPSAARASTRAAQAKTWNCVMLFYYVCGMYGTSRMERQGKASKARQGKARQGKARQGKARQGKVYVIISVHSLLQAVSGSTHLCIAALMLVSVMYVR